MVEAAKARNVRGFVLKSHHESTAGRAFIANDFAARSGHTVRVIGSVVLNPWITLVELQRAVELGARFIWWPTRDARGGARHLPLPTIHADALDLARAARCVVATGHLSLTAAVALVSDATSMGVKVIATHPFNSRVGLGVEGARRLGALGAIVEIDAFSIAERHEDLPTIAEAVRDLRRTQIGVLFSSDAGQAENGEPFTFANRVLRHLEQAGLGDCAELVTTPLRLVTELDHA